MPNLHDVMTNEVHTLRPKTPIAEALQLLVDNKISGAPVVSEDGQIIGVVSEVDLLSLFWARDAHRVEQIMTVEPVSFPVDTALSDVVDCLMSSNFRRVLIHDGENKLVGIVSRADLMPALLEALLQRHSPVHPFQLV